MLDNISKIITKLHTLMVCNRIHNICIFKLLLSVMILINMKPKPVITVKDIRVQRYSDMYALWSKTKYYK